MSDGDKVILAILLAWAIGLIVMLSPLMLAHGYTDLDENGNIVPPKLNCVKYSDGTLAVIQTEYCNEQKAYETVTWFLKKGYNLTMISSAYTTDERIFMVRK